MYRLLLLLHLISAVAAFGPPLVLARLARPDARAGADQARIILQRVVTPGLVGLIVFGAGLISAAEGDIYNFGKPWVSLAFLVVLAALAVVWLLLVPLQRRAAHAATQGEAAQLARRSAGMSGALHLLLVIGLVLMVWQPGQ
jgi:hypothetical protein